MRFTFSAASIAILIAGNSAFAHMNSVGPLEQVPVCLENSINNLVVNMAESMASKMFLDAGVEVKWLGSERACKTAGEEAIVVHLLEKAPGDAHSTALARSFPYEGVRLELFMDRISVVGNGLQGPIMAHVLVHEITHILQGVERHSPTGVMKARWTAEDFRQMRSKSLPFEPQDIELIHLGMARRAQKLSGAPASAATE